jgi:photosystem II stability/assembly factor-like uncharacterized protein
MSLDEGASWSQYDDFPIRFEPNDFVFLGDDPERILVSDPRGGGVLRSMNGGASWATTNRGLSGNLWNLQGALCPGGPMWAADAYGRVYRTKTSALLWEPVVSSLSSKQGVTFMAASPADPGRLLTARTNLQSLELAITVDSGESWTRVDDFGIHGGGRAVAIGADGTLVVAQPGQSGNLDVVFTSTDDGLNWSRFDVGHVNLRSIRTQPSYAPLYFGIGPNGISYSTDAGKSWQAGFFPGTVHDLAIDPVRPSRQIITNERGVGVPAINLSRDTGRTWTAGDAGGMNPTLDRVIFDAANPDRVAVSGTRVYLSSDGGLSFTPTEPTSWSPTDLAFGPDGKLHAITSLVEARFWRYEP